MHQQRETHRLQQADVAAVSVLRSITPGLLPRHQREQAVELHPIDPQARGQAAEYSGPVILG